MSDHTKEMLGQPSNVSGGDFGSRKNAENSKGRPNPSATFSDRHSVDPKGIEGTFGEKWGVDVPGKFEKKDTSS